MKPPQPLKRSEVNHMVRAAQAFFAKHHRILPPNPRWDVTDFGLGDLARYGLVLVNLAEEPEYCQKIMYAMKGQETPMHYHQKKKEDIICEIGVLVMQIGRDGPKKTLQAGERITLLPHTWHAFWPESEECIIAEVSTANDDVNDNFFANPEVGRYAQIVEDEPAIVALLSD
jgi:D-lyxose ketol-isomerase